MAKKTRHPLSQKLHVLAFPPVPIKVQPFSGLEMSLPTFRGMPALISRRDVGLAFSRSSIDLSMGKLSFEAVLRVGLARFGGAREEGVFLRDILSVEVINLGLIPEIFGAVDLHCETAGQTIELYLTLKEGRVAWPRTIFNPQRGRPYKKASALQQSMLSYVEFARSLRAFREFQKESGLSKFYKKWAEIVEQGNSQEDLDNLLADPEWSWMLKL